MNAEEVEDYEQCDPWRDEEAVEEEYRRLGALTMTEEKRKIYEDCGANANSKRLYLMTVHRDKPVGMVRVPQSEGDGQVSSHLSDLELSSRRRSLSGSIVSLTCDMHTVREAVKTLWPHFKFVRKWMYEDCFAKGFCSIVKGKPPSKKEWEEEGVARQARMDLNRRRSNVTGCLKDAYQGGSDFGDCVLHV